MANNIMTSDPLDYEQTPEEERADKTRAYTIKANKALKFMDIKGKLYAPVSERVKGFRFIYPNGGIVTKIISQTETDITIRAEVYDERGVLIASAHASENKNTGNINRFSMVENCESSAVGRALGFLSIGVQDGIASAEEVTRAASKREARDTFQTCGRCGRPITDAMNSKGQTYKAEQIAQESTKKFGMPLCMPCMIEIKTIKTDFEEGGAQK